MRVELLAQLKGTESAMPLVQFALTQLWQRRDPGRKVVPRAALSAIGGIGGALEMHANATLAQVSGLSPLASDRVREILLSLTTAQGTRATRTLVELRQRFAGDVTVSIVDLLESARLVVHERDGLTLAHEALLTRWGTLAGWITEAREDRLLAEAIERDAAEWSERGDPDRLWKKRRLVAAEDVARRAGVDLSVNGRAFVQAGRREERRARVLLASLAAVLAVAVGLTGLQYVRGIQKSQRATTAALAEATKAKDLAESKKVEADRARDDAQRAQGEAERSRQEAANKSQELEKKNREFDNLLARVGRAKTAAELAEAQRAIQDVRGGVAVKSALPPAAPPPATPTVVPPD